MPKRSLIVCMYVVSMLKNVIKKTYSCAGMCCEKGCERERFSVKTTHELLIKCVIIITSVVPRQFPMQVGFITINSFSESSGISSSTSTVVIVVVVVVAVVVVAVIVVVVVLGGSGSESSSAW